VLSISINIEKQRIGIDAAFLNNTSQSNGTTTKRSRSIMPNEAMQTEGTAAFTQAFGTGSTF
jgi:hypothetical protein